LTKEETELINFVTFKVIKCFKLTNNFFCKFIFLCNQEEDIEKIIKPSNQENEEIDAKNKEPVINNISPNFLKDVLCSDIGMYLIYLIIALISILVARRFYSA